MKSLDCVIYCNNSFHSAGSGRKLSTRKIIKIVIWLLSTVWRSEWWKFTYNRLHNTDGIKLNCIEQRRLFCVKLRVVRFNPPWPAQRPSETHLGPNFTDSWYVQISLKLSGFIKCYLMYNLKKSFLENFYFESKKSTTFWISKLR